MKDLSIVLRADRDKTLEYISLLKPILLNDQCELIIINNSIDRLNIAHSHTIYKFSGGNNKFKEFCFSSTSGSRVIIIDGNIQLNSKIVDDLILNLKGSNFKNTVYKFRKFLSINKPVYYTVNQVLIYNRGIKGFNNISEFVIDDFTLCDNNSLETNLNKFIEDKCFNELYLWYKHFILKQPEEFRNHFYLLLEFEKINLEHKDVNYIEGLFKSDSWDMDYFEYLTIKKELNNKSTSNSMIPAVKFNSLPSLDKAKYYSYIVYKIIRDRHDMFKTILAIDADYLKCIIEYLLSLPGFHEYLYNFILSINQMQDIDDKTKLSGANILLIKSYISHTSNLEAEPELKKKLLKLFETYMNNSYKLILDENNSGFIKEAFPEKDLVLKYRDSLIALSEGDVNKSVRSLKFLSRAYPDYERVLRYLIQSIRFEKNSYETIISICMIVKDEEKNLARCLSSLKPLLNLPSELIIADTGSHDRTVEIAKMYSQNIYFYKWQDSFSDARNFCISIAEGKYIFLLDADEEIEDSQISKIVDFFNISTYKDFNTCTLKIKNYTDINLKEYAIITQPRIFRNNTEFHYSGKVHNQPVFKLPVKHLPIYITHYGYIMTDDIKDKKFQRTANMLKLELQKEPQNIYYRFQLSTSYAMHGDMKDALNQAEIYMKKIRSEHLVNDDYIMYYNNAAILYLSSHLLKEASDICDEALKISPDFIDFVYYKALIYFETEDFESALLNTNKYLDLIDNFMNMDVASDGRYSFYTLGLKDDVVKMQILCNHRLGEYDEIIGTVGRYDTSIYKECLHAIVNAYLKSCRYSDLIKLYSNYCNDSNSKLVFRYFVEEHMLKAEQREKQIIKSTLVTLDCFDDRREELEGYTGYKHNPDINEALFIIEYYNIDLLNLNEARGLFGKLLPLYNSINTENIDIKEAFPLRKLGLNILKRSRGLKHYRDYTAEKQIHILRKYMDLSSILIKNKGADLLEEREQLFLIKIAEAFKQFGAANYDGAAALLWESVEIYRPMEGIIELIIKTVIPGYKKSTPNTQAAAIISDNSTNINSYANVVKKKITEASGKETGDILKILNDYSNKELYDPELFSYKSALLMSEGMFEEAGHEIEEGLAKYTNDIRLLSNLSRLYSLIQNYRKSFEVFCRVKLLYKDKCKLTLQELLPDSLLYGNPEKLKVLHGTMFENNKVNKIIQELLKKGIYAKALSYCPKYTGYSPDYVIDMNQYDNGNEIILRTLDTASMLLPEFDIFHFHFGSSLTFDYSDLPLINELGKKAILQLRADEVKISKNENGIDSPPLYSDKAAAIQKKLSIISKHVSCCIVSDVTAYGFAKDYFKEIHIIKEDDIDKLIDLYKSLL